jgi:hypothetical protein
VLLVVQEALAELEAHCTSPNSGAYLQDTGPRRAHARRRARRRSSRPRAIRSGPEIQRAPVTPPWLQTAQRRCSEA